MIPSLLSPLANHLWQSTLCVALAWLLTLTLRRNRAAVRHGIWLAASVKFLVPFSWLVDAGSRLGWRIAPEIAPIAIPAAIEPIRLAFAPQAVANPVAAVSPSSLAPAFLLIVWLCGVAVSAIVWLRLYLRFRATLRSATPLQWGLPIPVMTSPGRREPGVFGIRKPILLLPEGIAERLAPAQLRSILAHELCHVRRRDNLTGAIHMLVESIFWFHPLVWWLGARLVEERERACDEEVVRLGNEPCVYAEGILSVCRFSLRSPLPCAAGVSGGDLKRRIEAIVASRLSRKLTLSRKLLIAVAGVAAVAGPVFVGLIDAPRIRAQSTGLEFAVASIKPARPDTGGNGPRALGIGPDPGGGFRARRVNLRSLILRAYGIQDFQLSGGPGWTTSEPYEFEAKPEKPDAPADPQTSSARFQERLRALLADRFHLVVRKESKEVSTYTLVVAKGGPRLVESKPDVPRGGIRRGFGMLTSSGAPFEYFVFALTQTLGRPVTDETGLAGKRFDFELQFAEDRGLADVNPGATIPEEAADPSRPTIFAAIQAQLGLKVESRKSAVDSYVIERVEKPSAN